MNLLDEIEWFVKDFNGKLYGSHGLMVGIERSAYVRNLAASQKNAPAPTPAPVFNINIYPPATPVERPQWRLAALIAANQARFENLEVDLI